MTGSDPSPLFLFLSLPHHLGQICEVVQWKGDSLQRKPGSPSASPSLKAADLKHDAPHGKGVPLKGGLSEKEYSLLTRRLEEFVKAFITFTSGKGGCGIEIMSVWRRKLEKVRKKYPADACRGRADKYTAYLDRLEDKDADPAGAEAKRRKLSPSPNGRARSASRGSNKSGTTVALPTSEDVLESRDLLRRLVEDRDWMQFHTSRNLLLALTGELGEVSEEIQKIVSEVGYNVEMSKVSSERKKELGEEISDCWSYLVRFCDVGGLGLEYVVEKVCREIETV